MRLARALSEAHEAWFFLDGAAAPEGEPRKSYAGAAQKVLVALPGQEREFLEQLRPTRADPAGHSADSGSAGRFRSGWVIALSYEFGLGLLGIAGKSSAGQPSAIAMRIDRVLETDETDEGDAADAAANTDAGATNEVPVPQASPDLVWRRSQAAYESDVVTCQEAIHRGDAYVLCLTDTAEARVTGPYLPLDLYERLRAGGAAMRGGVLVAGDRALVSASPERFLSVRGRSVTTHPIKGTRRRGSTPADDHRLAKALAVDPKERAENLMIVDLMRNDLSRVCESGSVRVTRFLEVETHPRVHQLVSSVAGTLGEGVDVCDAIAACFPGGSMTGAPKHSAAEILLGIERGDRGLYSGCFGWIDDTGDAELAMTIRSVELRGAVQPGAAGTVDLRIGAGGGITAESVPARERAERELKAQALLSAL